MMSWSSLIKINILSPTELYYHRSSPLQIFLRISWCYQGYVYDVRAAKEFQKNIVKIADRLNYVGFEEQ